MAFLTFVLAAVVAEEIIQLEPVTGGNYNCDQITGASAQTTCTGNPYCHWLNSGSCIDDPCLADGVQSGATPCDAHVVSGVSIGCELRTVSTTQDCVGGTGKFCSSVQKGPTGTNPAQYDYCFWANFRDGGSNCPVTICEYTSKQCHFPSTTTTQCTLLRNKDECGLVPKCFYNNSQCVSDPCWGANNAGYQCSGKTITPYPGECKSFKPWILGAEVEYCVHEDNKSPNVCYFGTPDASVGSGSDYGTGSSGTYPTYPNPVCTGTIGSGCEGNGNCTTIINAKGALAGQYCTDGTHGNAGANILRIPSLLLLLALGFSLFAL